MLKYPFQSKKNRQISLNVIIIPPPQQTSPKAMTEQRKCIQCTYLYVNVIITITTLKN